MTARRDDTGAQPVRPIPPTEVGYAFKKGGVWLQHGRALTWSITQLKLRPTVTAQHFSAEEPGRRQPLDYFLLSLLAD